MRNRTLLKGAVAGAVGGLLGAWAMNEFQSVRSKLADKSGGDEPGQSQSEEQDEPATAKTAEAIAGAVLRRPLAAEEKKTAGTAVHYAFGTAMGGSIRNSCGTHAFRPEGRWGALRLWFVARRG